MTSGLSRVKPYINQEKLLINMINEELNTIDVVDFELITDFITANGDPDNRIDMIHPTRPILSPPVL